MQPLVCTVDPFLIILIIFFFNYILLFYSIWLLYRIQSIQNLEDKNLASDRSLMLIDVAWLIKVSPVFFAFFLFCDWSKQQETEISGNKVEVQQKTKFSIKLGLLEWLDKKCKDVLDVLQPVYRVVDVLRHKLIPLNFSLCCDVRDVCH